MTSTLYPSSGATVSVTSDPASAGPAETPLALAAGAELLGEVHGSGYADGAALVRRADGQMVQLGPLQYGVLEAADGHRSNREIAEAVSAKLGRRLDESHVDRLAEKLASQGLLAGSEAAAPPRRHPLLALRWKVLVTNPRVTSLMTAPFTGLFRPWVMWPVLAAFGAVCWFVLLDKGLAEPGAQAFHQPALLLLIFVIGVASAGFHELGHAAACRYGGATPGGMGVGVYLVWPAFYTDVTDAYRLDRRSRLRVDLAGLYFNAVAAVAITAIWIGVRVDALLLAVALQMLLMVKQLSPVIRADGYHILADATGVPDLFAHIGPTLKRLIPWSERSPSALTGRARALVTIWVLVVVPVLLSLMVGAVLLLPRLATSAWDTGRAITDAIPREGGYRIATDLLRLVALALPVLGSALVAQRLVRIVASKARAWSAGRPRRRAIALVAGAAVIAGIGWAWWPSGQYQPVRADERGTLPSLVSMLGAPGSAARPSAMPSLLPPGRYLAVAMVPQSGASAREPALLIVHGLRGEPVALLSTSAADPRQSPTTAFPFALPAPPGPGGTQALATNQTNGGVVYKVAYAVVTVGGNAAVTTDNSAYALASCTACTTVAVSYQVVLVVGQSHPIAPINAAAALNRNCPVCVTSAIADQLVATVTKTPPRTLVRRLEAALRKLNLISHLGWNVDPARITAEVEAVQRQIVDLLNRSGLLATPLTTATPTPAPTSTSAPLPAQPTSPDVTSSPNSSSQATASPSSSPSAAGTPAPSSAVPAGSTTPSPSAS